MAKRARHHDSFGRSHFEVTNWLTRKFQPACRHFRGRCVDEIGALLGRVSGLFQKRSAGANSRKTTKQLAIWQAFVMVHTRGLARAPATANFVAGLWEEVKDVVATRRGAFTSLSAHRITNRGPTNKGFRRGPKKGLS